jgi:hypothetical protein
MPKPNTRGTTSVQDILVDHAPPVRLLVERLRGIILQTVPEATESANPVWHSISYRHPRGGYFCGIFPFQDRVDLAFEFGVLLPDPVGLLEGNGKQVRYLRIKDDEEIPGPALRALLQAAINLPERRDVKLALIRASAKPASKDQSA